MSCSGTRVDGGAEYVFLQGTLRVRHNGEIVLHYRLPVGTISKAMDIIAGPVTRPEKLAQAIYELKEHELKICMPSSPHTEPFPERPVDFTPGTGKDVLLLRRKT
jgi:hypothetical protein